MIVDELRQLKDRHDAMPEADDQVVARARARLLAHLSAPGPGPAGLASGCSPARFPGQGGPGDRTGEKQFAYLEDGELKVVNGSEFEVTCPYLLSLPTGPAALLAGVYAEVDAQHARRQEERRGGRG
ncbi:hypothetical protein [Nonomuraea rubra]|uniref:hypothetical protein n=1 Tax=Nonomuraea rubra TaxID=46180 RepID=UPI0033C8E016